MQTAVHQKIRLDIWLFSVRLFKTRTQAADECGKGRVLVNGQEAKSSRLVCAGDIVSISRPPYTNAFKVEGITNKRISAKLKNEYFSDATSKEQAEKNERLKCSLINNRPKGSGRPTKKERRNLDKMIDL